MNKLILTGLIALALGGCASERHAHDEKGPASGHAGHGMAAMQDGMLRMHAQMHRIMDAKDPDERARLMHEHQEQMRAQMTMMGGQGGGMMGGHGGGGMMGAPSTR